MSARGVRIVVGEGPSTRKGLLRFVVDGEGYDVVAEASTTAELARLMATHRPDVVVLDDGIGATAVGMINEMSPNTKVVLVWPGAVMPIGGAARVEPSKVLQDLGPTIERLTGQPSATGSGRGPSLLEGATNDPAILGAMLLGGVPSSDELIIEDREPAPVVILPLTPTIDHDELILNVPDAESDDDRSGVVPAAVTAGVAGAAVLAGSLPAAAAAQGAAVGSITARGSAVGAQSALNRRLGNLALGGAAVASALVLALALGGARVPIEGLSGQAPTPISSTQDPVPTVSPEPDPGPDGDRGDGDGGDGGRPDGNDGGGNGGGDTPGITLVGSAGAEPQGPPDVTVDPADIGPGPDGDGGGGGGGGGGDDDGGGDGGGGGSGGDDDGGGDDHSGGDSGDTDRGGGNDRDGDDHDNGGGNDGDGDDHDNGGGNDDPDNPGHGDGGNGNGGNGSGH